MNDRIFNVSIIKQLEIHSNIKSAEIHSKLEVHNFLLGLSNYRSLTSIDLNRSRALQLTVARQERSFRVFGSSVLINIQKRAILPVMKQ